MTNNLPWFRVYSEILTDRKITRICAKTGVPKYAVAGFWTLLLAIANEDSVWDELSPGDTILTAKEFFREIDIEESTGFKIVDEMVTLGLISNGPYLGVLNWDKYKAPDHYNDWSKFRLQVFIRDRYCVYCGNKPEHLDHIVPRSRGGPSTPSNLVAACARCNQSKNDTEMFCWYRQQPFFNVSRLIYIENIQKQST